MTDTLNGDSRVLAEKLNRDPGYWAVSVFEHFEGGWECMKCDEKYPGNLRKGGKPRDANGMLLPKANDDKCTAARRV